MAQYAQQDQFLPMGGAAGSAGQPPLMNNGYAMPPGGPGYNGPPQANFGAPGGAQPSAGAGGGAGNPFGQMGMGGDMMQGAVGSAVFNYGEEKLQKFKGYVDVGHLKYYFQVDTQYVLHKLRLLLVPYTHKDWTRASPLEGTARPPKQDVNAPDLYIPIMAFVTYVLVVGLALGTQNQFSPEKLGLTSSSTLGWLLFEVALAYAGFYLFSIPNAGVWELVAYCSYKYVGMILCVVGYVVTRSASVYYGLLVFCNLSLAYFLVRSMSHTVLPGGFGDYKNQATQTRIYFLAFIALLQVAFMYWFTSYLVGMRPAFRLSTDG